MYRVARALTTPESKKQVESVVMYRVSGGDRAPEKKKQVKSAVMYRVSRADMTPEKKQVEERHILWQRYKKGILDILKVRKKRGQPSQF